MSFLDTPRFPDDISYRSKGGPLYNTTIIQVDSGYEQRNINWALPKCAFDVSYGVKTQAQLYSLIEFFHVVAGRGHSFRYKDWSDYKSCDDQTHGTVSDTDQTLGTGDVGGTVDFQLLKKYEKGALSRNRYITKPVAGTVVVSLDDVPQASGWTCNYATGVITFAPAPGNGVVVKAGFEYDVPVRFDSDSIETQFDNYDLGSTSVTLQEIRV